MAKTIGQLTQATTIGGADELVIEQGGLTKRVAASVVRGGLIDADIDAAAAIASSKLAQPLTLATAQVTTSGTSIDFTGIPSWVKRITVMLINVSTNGASAVLVQLGDSGGIETTGYAGSISSVSGVNASALASFSSGFAIVGGAAGAFRSGMLSIVKLSGNAWVASGTFDDGIGAAGFTQGAKSLSDTLDRIRLTTANGSDAFDQGDVNIMYEG
jgi:hypothetical protein